MKILLTGGSGFLGSHIAEVLCDAGHELLLTKRIKSNLWRCSAFVNKVQWSDTDSNTFESDVYLFKPDVIINASWDGVSAKDREEWSTQIENIQYQQRLLNIATKVGVKKFIGIGSQAEYGQFDGCVDESYPATPSSAYGAAKLSTLTILKAYCEENNITWYWFRLFSCFGEREAENWLIPATIKNMMFGSKMDLTQGEQRYSYLYIKDVATVFLSAIENNAESGVYHIAAETQRSLKDILEMIKQYLNPEFKLNFGALPYRKNQSMLNGSINIKTHKAFGLIEVSDFEEKLIQTIEYYKAVYDDK